MNWKHVKLIFTRELRDQLRDRRTLFTITILPILLYPLMGMLMLQIAQFSREHPVRIKIIGTENVPDSPALIQNGTLFPRVGLEYITPLMEIECESLPSDQAAQEKLETLAKETLTKGEIDLVVIFRPEFREYMERLAQTEVGSKLEEDLKPDQQNGISVVMTRSRDQSQIAYGRWDTVVELWQQEWVASKLRGAGFDPRLVRPLSIAPVDVAPESARKAIMWSKILPFVMLIWALS